MPSEKWNKDMIQPYKKVMMSALWFGPLFGEMIALI